MTNPEFSRPIQSGDNGSHSPYDEITQPIDVPEYQELQGQPTQIFDMRAVMKSLGREYNPASREEKRRAAEEQRAVAPTTEIPVQHPASYDQNPTSIVRFGDNGEVISALPAVEDFQHRKDNS